MKCPRCGNLQDVSKILAVASLPLLPLTAVLDVVNGYWRVCLEESYFLLMAENTVARGWSSALAVSTTCVYQSGTTITIAFTNLVPQ